MTIDVLRAGIGAAVVLGLIVPALPSHAEPDDVHRLLTAYPEQLSHIDGNALVWRDGTRMSIDDGRKDKSHEQLLSFPDLKDMFYLPYPAGRAGVPPPMRSRPVHDPGRVRHAALFDKLYGDCKAGTVTGNLVEIVWLAQTAPQKLLVTRINGVADKLSEVSRELEALPAAMRKYLSPAAGTYACRPIAGTSRVSAHGHGIAIDIAVATSDYWRWARGGAKTPTTHENRVPMEIVEIFERHGFIWGGKWRHYDTMHFEYRPELLPPASQRAR